MSEAETLRADAGKLRAAARRLRELAPALDDDLANVQQKYPLPSDKLWSGTHAQTYADRLSTAKTQVGKISSDVEGFAAECDRVAFNKEQEAARLDKADPGAS